MATLTTVERLRSDLNRNKTKWLRMAADCQISYWTILRIANGSVRNPKIETVEAIQKALQK